MAGVRASFRRLKSVPCGVTVRREKRAKRPCFTPENARKFFGHVDVDQTGLGTDADLPIAGTVGVRRDSAVPPRLIYASRKGEHHLQLAGSVSQAHFHISAA